MSATHGQKVQMISIDAIQIVNPRSRGQGKFKQIVDNIAQLGLKKPVVVRKVSSRDGKAKYELVCGQGRIEAYQALGESQVPALVVEVSRDELMLMSLAENMARRRYTALELAKEIGSLHKRKHSFAEIARKTGLDPAYVRGICRLLKNGEERLIKGVEDGHIPLTIAITIASTKDQDIQTVLADAYESKALQGKQLLKARRLIESRRIHGKACRGRRSGRTSDSAENLIQIYKRETNKQQHIVKKAKVTETRLLFVVNALKSMLRRPAFVELLEKQKLDSMPQNLADQVYERGACET